MKLAGQIKQCPRGAHYKSTIKPSSQLDAGTEVVYAIKHIKYAHQSNLGGPACLFVDKTGIQSAPDHLDNAYALCDVGNESERKDQSWIPVQKPGNNAYKGGLR